MLQVFRLLDRKDTQLLLAPTHEEEVTQLVKQDVISSKQLPVRLFHIGSFLSSQFFDFDALPY